MPQELSQSIDSEEDFEVLIDDFNDAMKEKLSHVQLVDITSRYDGQILQSFSYKAQKPPATQFQNFQMNYETRVLPYISKEKTILMDRLQISWLHGDQGDTYSNEFYFSFNESQMTISQHPTGPFGNMWDVRLEMKEGLKSHLIRIIWIPKRS
jgi:hypothetical protein